MSQMDQVTVTTVSTASVQGQTAASTEAANPNSRRTIQDAVNKGGATKPGDCGTLMVIFSDAAGAPQSDLVVTNYKVDEHGNKINISKPQAHKIPAGASVKVDPNTHEPNPGGTVTTQLSDGGTVKANAAKMHSCPAPTGP